MKNEISTIQQIILFLLLVFIVVPTIVLLLGLGVYFFSIVVGLGDFLALVVMVILSAIAATVFEHIGKL